MQRCHFLTTTIVVTAISFLFTAPESRAQAHTKGRPVAATSIYSVTCIGTTVIIADNKSAPSQTLRPGLLFSGKTGTVPPGGFVWRPETAPKGPISIIVSAPDGKVYVYRNGVEIGRLAFRKRLGDVIEA